MALFDRSEPRRRDKHDGLIERVVETVRHAHEDHVQREHARHEHQVEDIQALAEHNHDTDRKNLPF